MMNAVIKHSAGPGNIEFTSVPVPRINADQALIEVKTAGVCGTDIALYHWKEAVAKGYNISFPRILGHEFSGVVTEVGAQVKNIRPGDRVTVNPIMYCRDCSFCDEGIACVCDHRPMLGADLDGGFAQYVAVRAVNVLKIPDNVTFESAAVIEPLCVAIHAVERITPEIGDVAVVIGAGAIGLLIAMVLKEVGAGRVIVTGLNVDEDRLAIARTFGVETINVEKEDPVAKVKGLSGGKGADVVFEAAGHSSAVQQAIKIAGKRGRIGLTGFPGTPTEIMTTELAMTEKSIIGTRAHELKTWKKAFKMLSLGMIYINPIVTHQLPLREVEKAFQLVDNRQGLRIMLVP